MTTGLLWIWLLVGIDVAGEEPWTADAPPLETTERVEAMDGPVLPPPPPNP